MSCWWKPIEWNMWVVKFSLHSTVSTQASLNQPLAFYNIFSAHALLDWPWNCWGHAEDMFNPALIADILMWNKKNNVTKNSRVSSLSNNQSGLGAPFPFWCGWCSPNLTFSVVSYVWMHFLIWKGSVAHQGKILNWRVNLGLKGLYNVYVVNAVRSCPSWHWLQNWLAFHGFSRPGGAV